MSPLHPIKASLGGWDQSVVNWMVLITVQQKCIQKEVQNVLLSEGIFMREAMVIALQ
jgi:hypothetical protein